MVFGNLGSGNAQGTRRGHSSKSPVPSRTAKSRCIIRARMRTMYIKLWNLADSRCPQGCQGCPGAHHNPPFSVVYCPVWPVVTAPGSLGSPLLPQHRASYQQPTAGECRAIPSPGLVDNCRPRGIPRFGPCFVHKLQD